MKWEEISTEINGRGEKTITYQTPHSSITIESRKRAIPRASGEGCWMYTSYFAVSADGEKECRTLRDAEIAAEQLIQAERDST